MDCEILFHGKRLDNGEWVQGYLFCIWGQAFILWGTTNGVPNMIEVDPETVSRYTGLTDKNGVKIFEMDIVKFTHGGEFDEKGIYFRNYVVEFINTFSTYGLRLRNKRIHFPFKQATATVHDAVVIGNIHDNPELMEEG